MAATLASSPQAPAIFTPLVVNTRMPVWLLSPLVS